MSFSWPWALVALLAFPALLAFRWWTRRRRRREAVRLSSLTLIRAALPGRSSWRRRIPIWLFAIGLIALGTGAARPQASMRVPKNAASILLAIDVSQSMCSTDVQPNRITAAQEAARTFIKAQDDEARIGLVAFAGIAGLLVEPTSDKRELLAAIDGLKTSRGTAIGMAILASVDAIAEVNPAVPPTGVSLPAATPDGEFEPDTIVVLTDGRNTQGVDPVAAAQQAAARKLRVYTIGFGTTNPAASVCTADQLGGDATAGDRPRFGGGGPGAGRNFRQLDEQTLTTVADSTGGEYFKAEDAEELGEVLLDLPKAMTFQRQDVELTVWFALVGALLVAGAVGLAQWWNRTTVPSVARAAPTP
ncbi:UPF0353 protein [Virgisporangium aliadipatigenens]|uniref:UPF0353 protein n=1 Tax=Virgisporangium aliadipatigenens TaxID=741659 RepID=A0A8J3YRD6_9ACTN|nr:VWA domain-containing protein [Virgisporangium aliadipatigenens]GIJ49217.1 UPF0353 protein [Virgisporangium aliadipatigenens]